MGYFLQGIIKPSSFLENILILHFVFTNVAKTFLQRVWLLEAVIVMSMKTDWIYQFFPEKRWILLSFKSRRVPRKINKGNSFLRGFVHCLEIFLSELLCSCARQDAFLLLHEYTARTVCVVLECPSFVGVGYA